MVCQEMEDYSPPSLFYTTGATTVIECWLVDQSAKYNSINKVFQTNQNILFSAGLALLVVILVKLLLVGL